MRRTLLFAVLLASISAIAAGPSVVSGAPPSCPPGQVNGDYCEQTACKGVHQVGDNNPNVQNGTECDDDQEGNGGDDKQNGYGGEDKQDGGDGNDTIDGGRGKDKQSGGNGNDDITGGPGKDNINGDAGNDTIHAQDGEADLIDCGAGSGDVAYTDSQDHQPKNCETVFISP
jgi:hypothetical protein